MRDRRLLRLPFIWLVVVFLAGIAAHSAIAAEAPTPLLKKGEPVDWWFSFKFNGAVFPGCSGNAERVCVFGGTVRDYRTYGQQFIYASSNDHRLQKGSGCAGDSVNDPLGATFEEVYNSNDFYVVWNDQFYGDPEIDGCSQSCSAPWAHSKGLIAWNAAGDGLVLQVTTPSWPASGSRDTPRRTDGNTLGCIKDNDVQDSQHFFALELTHSDVITVLRALQNASVVTVPGNRQIVRNGGPRDIQDLVRTLGFKSPSTTYTKDALSSGVVLISKPSKLHVPPWQMVSAILDGVGLRAATWWATPQIYSTTAPTKIGCWDASLSKPGPVEIATTGRWAGKVFSLIGGFNRNHAKIGVSTSGPHHYVVFGDMNQQGRALSGGDCGSSQNGRGGLFFVLDDPELFDSVSDLIAGSSAPKRAPH